MSYTKSETMTLPPSEPQVFFSHQSDGHINAVTVSDGHIIFQERLQGSSSQGHWVDALQQMSTEAKRPSGAAGNASDPPQQHDMEFEFSGDFWPDVSLDGGDPSILSEEQMTAFLDTNPIEPSIEARQPPPNPPSRPGAPSTFPMRSHHSSASSVGSEMAMMSSPSYSSRGSSYTTSSSISPIRSRSSEQIYHNAYGGKARASSATDLSSLAQPLAETTSLPSGRLSKPDVWDKRTAKADEFLDILAQQPIPSQLEYNQKVDSLYEGPRCPLETGSGDVSIVRFAGILSQMADVSGTVSFVYGMLAWYVFWQEEQRLINDEDMSPIVAAKHANKWMAECLNRRVKTKDWASDGRKASRMVLEALDGMSPAVKSYALIMLGSCASLDRMLKIAHFPVLREHFKDQFQSIMSAHEAEIDSLSHQGYRTFDFEEFLQSRGSPKSEASSGSFEDDNLGYMKMDWEGCSSNGRPLQSTL